MGGLILLGVVLAGGAWLVGGAGQAGGLGAFIAILIGVAFFAAYLLLSIRWALAQIIVALEPVGPRQALARSWRLTSGVAWRTFGILFLTGVIGALTAGIASVIVGRLIIGSLVTQSPFGEHVVDAVLSSVTGMMIAPLASVALAVFFLDLRTTREGWTSGAPTVSVDPSPLSAADGDAPPG